MATSEQIRGVAAPLLEAAGLELWDVEVSRDAVRFFVERPGGIDLDGLSAASRVLSPLLDERDDLVPAGHYELEVSSPGVERTLRTPEQYRRYLGSPVSVKTVAPLDGSRRFQGILTAVEDDCFTIRSGDPLSSGTDASLRYEQVERTRTVLVWGTESAPRSRPQAARTTGKSASVPGVPYRKDAAS